MDGGKSGLFSLLLLVGILALSVLSVTQKSRTESRLKKMDETLNSIGDELKKNMRDISTMKGDFGLMSENFKETRLNLKDFEVESKVLSSRVDSAVKAIENLGRGISDLNKDVKDLEIRASKAPSDSGAKPDKNPKTPSGSNGETPGGAKPPDEPKAAPPGPGTDTRPDRTEIPVQRVKYGPKGPTKAEADALWDADSSGVVRPVIDDYTANDYNPARNGGTLVAVLTTDPKGFNPLTENSSDVSDLQSYCWSSLCTRLRHRPEIWVYDLAESCEISNDFKVYTFRIRKGVMWQKPLVNYSDEKFAWLKDADLEVTARDFQFCFELIMNPQVPCASTRNYYEDIEKIEVLDRYTLRITWKRKVYQSISVSLGFNPIAEFLFSVSENGERFPDESLGNDFNEHWYNNKIHGCGQFHFGEWDHGVSVTLVKNPDYYGRPTNIDKLVFPIIREDDQILLNTKNHEIQTAGLTMSQYKQEIIEKGADSMFFRKGEQPVGNQKIEYDFFLRFAFNYIGWNLENPKFKDRRVREAMTYACPRRKVLKEIFQGLGDVVTGEIYRYHPYYNEDLPERPFDLDKAKDLLAQAGWEDSDGNGIIDKVIDGQKTEFEFHLLVYGHSKEFQALADAYKECLRKIGVNLISEALDWALMQKKMESREFEAYTGGWALGWEVDPYQIWHSSQADEPKSSNMVSFRNAEADKIIEEGRVTFSEAKRRELFRRFHEILYIEQPYTFLYCLKSIPTWWSEVKNVEFSLIRPQTYKGKWYLSK